MRIDAIDRHLLHLLQGDSSLSYAALGSAVGLSVSAINDRVRKLERLGAIRGYAALVAPEALGAAQCCYATIRLRPGAEAAPFLAAIGEMPQVLECHETTGAAPFLVKLRGGDLPEVNGLLRQLRRLPGVAAVESSLVLETAKGTHLLPGGAPEAARAGAPRRNR